ncbi:MAG: hypothetical protein GEU86_18205 [Actinophytocola sp.]|nr:hypothetical protein [Actinophytocola sp.]
MGPQSLRDAAKAAAEASKRVERVEIREPLTEFESAMPGAQVGQEASELGWHFNGLAKGWAKGMELYGESLVAAAERYEGDDEAIEDDFNRFRGPR